jgi:hypothetical protein
MDITHQQFTEAFHPQSVSVLGMVRDVGGVIGGGIRNSIMAKFVEDNLVVALSCGESIINRLDEFEAEHCHTCSEDCGMILRDDLAALVDGYTKLLEQHRRSGIAEALISREEDLLDRLDNKLENYAFAADSELRDLVRQVSAKYNSNANLQA